MSDMLEQIRTLGDQLRWARDLDAPELTPNPEVLVGGMGGSGIAGDYGAALAGPTQGRVAVHKGYGPLPGWVGRSRPTVIAASYSGNTEETLDLVGAAAGAGLPIVTITTGGRLGELTSENGWPGVTVPSGMQPRAAVGYMAGAVARLLTALDILPDQGGPLDEAADLADSAVTEGSETWNLAHSLAAGLVGKVTIVYGGGPVSSTAAQRWKTQINENAKMPAWWSALPELDHNEIVGWETLPETTRDLIGIIALTDEADHPRVANRLGHTSALTESAVPWLAEVAAKGDSELARLISLTVCGDLVSYLLAIEAGVDPVPVDTIEKLKELLAKD
ncbi:MAG TPA: bifunctional phosphoglucose/phosphomannose isomerase [Acidimicrobiia bacterium]|nr:bifunctional phosphoglucose/phosphomannose isomerase [Acidimicrobiia bacterium]